MWGRWPCVCDVSRKRRGHSVCSLEEDLVCPVGICLFARVPVRARQVLVIHTRKCTHFLLWGQCNNCFLLAVCQEAHEQGINAVRFSSNSHLLATGGTDRVIKLWEVRAGMWFVVVVFVVICDAIVSNGVVTSLMMSSGLLTHRATLDGSTEGITSIDFNPNGKSSSSSPCCCGYSSCLTCHSLICELSSGLQDPRSLLW